MPGPAYALATVARFVVLGLSVKSVDRGFFDVVAVACAASKRGTTGMGRFRGSRQRLSSLTTASSHGREPCDRRELAQIRPRISRISLCSLTTVV
jgi:hypothetical protein